MPPHVSLPLALQTAGLVGGLFVGVLAFPLFDFGVWPRVELPTLALWLAASLCAVGQALDARHLPRRLVRSPLVLGLAGLVGLTVVLAPLAPYPWLSFTGAPQGGEGALRYLASLVLIISAISVRRHAGIRLFLMIATAAATVTMAVQAHLKVGGEPIFVFREYLAYAPIALAAMALAELRWTSRSASDRPRKVLLPAVMLAIAGVVLAVSTNRSAWLGAGAAAILSGLAVSGQWARFADGRTVRRVLVVVVAGAPWAILAAIALAGLEAPVESIRSRALVLAVFADAVGTTPSLWAVGTGWGYATDLFAMHLTAAPAPLWDGSWDAAGRDLFHSHHGGLEAFLALGIGGAALWTVVLVAPLLMAPAALLPAAIFLCASLAVVDAMWFQFPFTVAAVALATAWVIGAQADEAAAEPVSAPAHRAGAASAAIALALATGLVGAWGARFADARRVALTTDAACAEFPLEGWRGHVGLAYVFNRSLQAARPALAAGLPASGDGAALMRLFCTVDLRATADKSRYLMMVGLLFRNEVFFAPDLAPGLREALAAQWESRVRDFLHLARRRTDLAAPLLAIWLQQRQFVRVRDFTDAVLARSPNDPVALYFSGVALIAASESARQRDEGIRRLQRAVENGIERIIPLSAEIRNIISA
jgi:hypothetical protein